MVDKTGNKDNIIYEFDESEMSIIEVKTLTLKQGLSQIGGFISLNLMVYGIITSALLPIFFYDKLSIYFLEKKYSNDPIENLKEGYDRSKDIIGMNGVLKKIFSFENIVWINNQVYSLIDVIKSIEESSKNQEM
jgi:hypothetical protein